jgi:hypothetical protein
MVLVECLHLAHMEKATFKGLRLSGTGAWPITVYVEDTAARDAKRKKN